MHMHVLYFSVTYDMHMHILEYADTLHNVHMRVPYGTESLPKRASLTQHCMVAAARVDPIWPKLVFSGNSRLMTVRCMHDGMT